MKGLMKILIKFLIRVLISFLIKTQPDSTSFDAT